MLPTNGLIDWIGGAAGDAINKAAQDAWVGLAAKVYDGTVVGLKWLATLWMNLPAPVLTNAEGDTPAQKVILYTRALAAAVGFITTVVMVMFYAMRKNGEGVELFGWTLARTVIFSGLSLSATSLLLAFGDQSAPWFVQKIGGDDDFNRGFLSLSGNQKDVTSLLSNQGMVIILLIVFLLALIGTILNFFFVLFSYGMIPIVAGMIPVLAAASGSDRGMMALNKVLGWTLATCLFKPVAAIIYGGGIAMIKILTSSAGSKLGSDQVAMQTMAGFMVIAAAGLTLPALIRLVVPTMAAASRGVGGASLLMAGASVAAAGVTMGASLTAKAGAATGSRLASVGQQASQVSAAGARGGAAGAGAAGAAGQSSPPRGLVNPSRHGYASTSSQGASKPPQAPPLSTAERRGVVNRSAPAAQQAGTGTQTQQRPPQSSEPSFGRRRMGSAGNHMSNHMNRLEDGIEGGEA